MIKRIYDIDELTESAELIRSGPPWWLHAALFALILLVLAGVSVLLGTNGDGMSFRVAPSPSPAATPAAGQPAQP
jgi:hypothetical protein